MRAPWAPFLVAVLSLALVAQSASGQKAASTVEETTATDLFPRHSVVFPENSLCRNISTLVFGAPTSSCRRHQPEDNTYPHTNLE
jgi:hypothetical protein